MNNQIIAYSNPEYKPGANLQNARQLELFPLATKRQKPQIVSVPGTSPKERDRYRVMIGNEILGDRLSVNEALRVVKRGAKP
jgi:hypothetical protein